MGAICIESEQQGRTRLEVHEFAKKAIENTFLIESHETRKKNDYFMTVWNSISTFWIPAEEQYERQNEPFIAKYTPLHVVTYGGCALLRTFRA